MSKDKPEVGDVWRSLGSYKKYILATSKNAVRFLAIGNWGCQPKIIVQNIDTFMRITTYLGKSKANIEQLFKVEDNERCVEDNTPHTESTVLFKDLENE